MYDIKIDNDNLLSQKQLLPLKNNNIFMKNKNKAYYEIKSENQFDKIPLGGGIINEGSQQISTETSRNKLPPVTQQVSN